MNAGFGLPLRMVSLGCWHQCVCVCCFTWLQISKIINWSVTNVAKFFDKNLIVFRLNDNNGLQTVQLCFDCFTADLEIHLDVIRHKAAKLKEAHCGERQSWIDFDLSLCLTTVVSEIKMRLPRVYSTWEAKYEERASRHRIANKISPTTLSYRPENCVCFIGQMMGKSSWILVQHSLGKLIVSGMAVQVGIGDSTVYRPAFTAFFLLSKLDGCE